MLFREAIWTLLLPAPFVGEVLSGATRTSVLFVFLPEVMVGGVGALLSREIVRRWGAGLSDCMVRMDAAGATGIAWGTVPPAGGGAA